MDIDYFIRQAKDDQVSHLTPEQFYEVFMEMNVTEALPILDALRRRDALDLKDAMIFAIENHFRRPIETEAEDQLRDDAEDRKAEADDQRYKAARGL